MFDMNTCTEDLSSLSKRILHALEYTGVKKATLAHLIGVKPQVIQYLCQGDSQSSRFTFEIATALEVNPKWLATGEGPMLTKPTSQHDEFRQIPLLSGNSPKEIKSAYDLDNYYRNLSSGLYTDNSEVDFAYIQSDPSMEPNIPNNSMLFFKLSKDNHKTNNIVLAYIDALNITVIRQIRDIGNNLYLYPFNDALFKPISLDDNVKIIAQLAECRWKA